MANGARLIRINPCGFQSNGLRDNPYRIVNYYLISRSLIVRYDVEAAAFENPSLRFRERERERREKINLDWTKRGWCLFGIKVGRDPSVLEQCGLIPFSRSREEPARRVFFEGGN